MDQQLTQIDPRYSDMPDQYFIHDYRQLSEFKKKTFNNYQKSDVLSALQKSIIDNKLEEACHWGAELLVSGNVLECWDRLIIINSKLINLANPCLSFYLWSRFVQQVQLTLNPKFHGDKILGIRNSQEARNHLTDIITLLTLSSKNKIGSLPKVQKEDFRLDNFEAKLEAKNTYLIANIIKADDPSEINVVVNELAFQLTLRVGDMKKALYWLNWILEWEKLNLKKTKSFNCALRKRKYVKPQYYHDIIWLLWDVIFQEASIRGSGHENMNSQLIGLFKLYRYGFTSSSKKRKISLLIHAVHILCLEPQIKWTTPIIAQPKTVIQATANTNFLYLDYKKKAKTKYQRKAEGLQVLTRDNYLVSSQKAKLKEENSKKKKPLDDKLKKRFDYVNNAIMRQTTAGSRPTNSRPTNSRPINPRVSRPSRPAQEPFQKTEDVLNQIQDLIRK